MRARREEILDTAGVSARGFHAATVDDVAAAAGVSKGSPYLPFDTKESMIDGLTEKGHAVDAEAFDAADRDRQVGWRKRGKCRKSIPRHMAPSALHPEGASLFK